MKPTLKKVYRATMAFLRERKKAYMLTFPNGPHTPSNFVLKDLAKFCCANTSCMVADVRVHAFNEGKRAVWLRITQHLNLAESELYDLYGGIPVENMRLTEEENDV